MKKLTPPPSSLKIAFFQNFEKYYSYEKTFLSKVVPRIVIYKLVCNTFYLSAKVRSENEPEIYYLLELYHLYTVCSHKHISRLYLMNL